ncbi:MAG: uracil phosphoribosyltransferase [Candidatus Nanohaloarchaea archaeon]|nr:uracil phosphoribosyltransferase [Candidatus Nanohaloarchaea archaeon]
MDWDTYDRDEFLDELSIDVETLDDNPAVDHQLSKLRDRETEDYAFEDRMRGLSQTMGYRVAEDLETRETTVETPLEEADARYMDDAVVVPILRAGLAMRDGLRDSWQDFDTGFIDAWRDEDLSVEVDYLKLPDLDEKTVVLTDPMVATGHTLTAVYEAIEDRFDPERYVVMSAISVPEGIKQVDDVFPDDTAFYTGTIDDERYGEDFMSPGLNEHGYIVPGLGDAGDRLYGEPDEVV